MANTISPQFTPYTAAAGGLAIGAVAVSRLMLWGKVTGISGILAGVINRPFPGDWAARAAFATGLVTCGYGLKVVGADCTEPMKDHGIARLGVAGILVGFGTQLGNGCTSGHGICGIARLSPRSLIATPTFMITAIGTAILTNTSTRVYSPTTLPDSNSLNPAWGIATAIASLGIVGFATRIPSVASKGVATVAQEFFLGTAFAAGLGISGMSKPSKVAGFLDPLSPNGWDPSLALVMGGALAVALPAFRAASAGSKLLPRPALAPGFSLPSALARPDLPLLSGAGVFGVGWGLAGICPGPAMVNLGTGELEAAAFVVAMLAGIMARPWLHGAWVPWAAPLGAVAAAAAVTAVEAKKR